MAERRMFAKTIIDSDAFLDMPLSTQALYFHLVMRGDDEGFVNNPKKIMRMVGASDDEMRVLITKRFLIPFESGVVVVKHWFIHNYIQKDRFKPSVYAAEREKLTLKENGAYTENGMDTACIQNVSNLDAQYKLKETNLNEHSIGDCAGKPTQRFKPPTLDAVSTYCSERGNKVDPEKFIDYYTANGWKVGKNNMKDWKAAIRTWEKNTGQKGKVVSFQNYDQGDSQVYSGPDLLKEAREGRNK